MYNKLFTKILDSSIWMEKPPTRIVWITFLAAMDEDGFVPLSSVPNVSARARLPLRATEMALAVLEAPDKISPDQENEGRRIERVPGGWMVLNAAKYRDMVNRITIREQTRLRTQRWRAKQQDSEEKPKSEANAVSVSISGVTDGDNDVTVHASHRFAPPSVEEVKGYCDKRGNSVNPQTFVDFYESKGWLVGKSPMRSWKAAVRTWEQNPINQAGGANGRKLNYAEQRQDSNLRALEEAKRQMRLDRGTVDGSS